MNFELLVEKYQRLTEMKAARENEIKKINEAVDVIKSKLLEVFNEKGIDSLKTPIGTIYKSTRASASIADWDVFFRSFRSTNSGICLSIAVRLRKPRST